MLYIMQLYLERSNQSHWSLFWQRPVPLQLLHIPGISFFAAFTARYLLRNHDVIAVLTWCFFLVWNPVLGQKPPIYCKWFQTFMFLPGTFWEMIQFDKIIYFRWGENPRNYQLMLNWWFGILGLSLTIPGIQTTGPQTTNLPLYLKVQDTL